MERNHNTDQNGGDWSEEIKKLVWAKGVQTYAFDTTVCRKDKCGHLMEYSQYGNRNSDRGWEIDHINPVANGGKDDIANLQPLYWGNNAEKGDNLNWTCPR